LAFDHVVKVESVGLSTQEAWIVENRFPVSLDLETPIHVHGGKDSSRELMTLAKDRRFHRSILRLE
jgi:hypothetical protein